MAVKDDEHFCGLVKSAVEMGSNGAPLHVVSATGADEGRRSNVSVPKVSSPRSSPSAVGSPRPDCRVLAQQLAVQAVSKCKQDQWGLLTALSDKARKRPQGCHIMLHSPEHVLGRVVPEVSCQFDSPAVSGRHCTITRRLVTIDGRVKNLVTEAVAAGDTYAVFVKDSSSNGTYINKERLKKNGPEVVLRHGDIISLVSFPEHDNAFAFVFRELVDDSTRQHAKRKISSSDHEVEGSTCDGKRIKGTGKAASEGPVSLDDVRRLQRSNEELRQQLEAHVLEIEKLRGEFRAAEALHVVELKELRASVTETYSQKIEEIRLELVSKLKELEESTSLCVQHQTTIEDLNHRLSAAAQSRVDAEEAIQSHTNSIAELKKRLEDEFCQRQKDRAEWEANLEAAVERTRIEASEELKRQSEASARMQKQQQEIIVDLQEADKENRRLADSLRMKLEAERQAVIKAEDKGRRIGVQLQEERLSTENACKRTAELEEELRQVYKQLENEKVVTESAGAKVASLELAMESAIRDLTLEKQRLQGARERIVLRETQLRAFYSTAAQVEALQQKQQEQLKLMLRTLEDGDGDGDYSQSKKSDSGKTDGVGDEKRIVGGNPVSLVSKQTSSPLNDGLQTNLQGNGNSLADHANCRGGKNDKKVIDEGGHDQEAGHGEPDWMDGDTQQEEDCLAVINDPPGSNSPDAEVDDTIKVQQTLAEEDKVGFKAMNSNPGDTQLLEHGLAATTQILTDTFQEIGPREGDVFSRESVGGLVVSRIFCEVRKSQFHIDVETSISRPGPVQEGHRSPEGDSGQAEKEYIAAGYYGATMELDCHNPQGHNPVELVRIEAGENEGVSPCEGTNPSLPPAPVLDVRSRNSGSYQDTQLETRDKQRDNQDTMCTDDLLASETAGSWAVGGTQASVQADNEAGSQMDFVGRMRSEVHDTQLEGRENELTMCTDDLLASEVAGSWRSGTPASVHADNESISSDEGNPVGIEEVRSQQAVVHPQGCRLRSNPQHILLEEVLHFADPVNSQNSLSPATTAPLRNEREALNEMLDIVEPGFGSLHGLSRLTRHQSDIEDSTTDEEDEDENEIEANVSNDASKPLNPSPSVSVR